MRLKHKPPLSERLLELAATKFDPDDYKKEQLPSRRCDHCGVQYAPGGVCGYCRGRVKMIRDGRVSEINWTGEGPLPKPAKAGPRIYVEPQLPKEADSDDEGM